MRVGGWTVRAAGEPMVLDERDEAPLPGDAIVAVAGCGVCHTDLGFYYEGVPTRHGFPLVLGHEISGVVVDAGTDERAWLGRKVVVPAVMPCGRCDACRDGRGAICPHQVFPGSDIHGGFATHVRVPARGEVLVTGGLAGDLGLVAALREAVAAQQVDITIEAHEDSVLAGTIGAAKSISGSSCSKTSRVSASPRCAPKWRGRTRNSSRSFSGNDSGRPRASASSFPSLTARRGERGNLTPSHNDWEAASTAARSLASRAGRSVANRVIPSKM